MAATPKGFAYEIESREISGKAIGVKLGDQFIVLKGSRARKRWVGESKLSSHRAAQKVYDRLTQKGSIKAGKFHKNVLFDSMTEAASVVMGYGLPKNNWKTLGGIVTKD